MMKQTWIIFIFLIMALATYGLWFARPTEKKSQVPAATRPHPAGDTQKPVAQNWLSKAKSPSWPVYTRDLARRDMADRITAYGLKQIGTPYLPAGTTRAGFDCSGFVHHIFGRFGVHLPHASALLIDAGKKVPLKQVKKGDLLIFTGPGGPAGKPGHVGVVITRQGQSPAFVHSSSAGGVKISKVTGTGYQKRFLEARRVL